MTCTACPLHENARTVCNREYPPRPADVLIVLDQPDEDADRKGAPTGGADMEYLYSVTRGWRVSLAVTFLVKCRPPGDRPAAVKEKATCVETWWSADLAAYRPKIVVAMGAAAAQHLVGIRGVLKKAGKTFKSPLTDAPVMVAPAPGYVRRNPTYANTFASLMWKVPALVEQKVDGDYQILDDPKAIAAYLRQPTEAWAFDYETTELSPFTGRVMSVAVSPREGEARIFDPKKVPEVWKRWLLSPVRKAVHNFYFEAIWSILHFDAEPRNTWDTQLFAKLQDENASSHLKDLAVELFDIGNYAHGVEPGSAGWENQSLDDLRVYNCGDADATRRLYRLQQGLRRDL